MAIPQMFNPIKAPIQTGVVGAFGKTVTPQQVKQDMPKIKVQQEEKVISSLGQLSPEEIAFAQKAKAAGFSKAEAASSITRRRQSNIKPTTGQRIGAAAVGFSQGLSDVGQNTVGQIGRLGERTGAAIARGLGIDESRIQKIEQDNVTRREMGILPAALGDMATSREATIGRSAGKIAGAGALAAGASAVGGGAIMSALGGPASTVLGGIAKGAISGASGGALGTQAATIGGEGRLATAKETAIGAALGGAVGGVMGGRAVSQANKVQGLFSEKGTAKQLEQAAREGRVKFTSGVLKSRGEITPTERVANGVKVLQQKIKGISSKDPQKIINEAGDIGRKMATDLADDLSQIKVGTMTKFKAGVKNQIDEVAGLTNQRTNSQVKQITNLKNKIPKAKTADDLWKIRMEWDDLFSEAQKNIGPNPAPNTAKANRLRQSVRKILNDELDDVVSSQGGPNVKKAFYDMSSIIEARNNLVRNIPNLVKETPTKAGQALKYIGAAGVGAGGLGVLNSMIKSASGQ